VRGPAPTVATLAVPPQDTVCAVTTPSSADDPVMTWQYLEEPLVRGTLQFARMAGVSIGRVRAGAHRVAHESAAMPDPASPDLHVILQLSGTNSVEQCGRSFTLGPGQWVLVPGNHAYVIASDAKTERLVMVIGWESLAVDVKPADLVGRICSAAHGAGRLFFSTAVCLADELPHLRTQNAEELAQQLITLLHIALRSESTLSQPEDDDLRREQVYRYIARHLRDPQLSVERIAAGLGWSRRTLARILKPHGETVMEHLYRKRLEGSRADLLNPLLGDHALADIARSWGFRNYTHFSDRFRSQFGSSPMAVRRRVVL
jgi:AraC-like DNA-binding protein